MDAVIIAVAHKQFRQMPVEKIRSLMNDHPVLVDVRGWLMRSVPIRMECIIGNYE